MLWVIRSHFLVELRSRGISHITIEKKTNVEDLFDIFPDSNSWIQVMAKHTQATTVQELLTQLGSQKDHPNQMHSHAQG